jgi:amidase
MQKQSLLNTLLASRGDAQAARARLSAAKARADELEPWLRAFTSRADTYDVDAAVNGPLAGLPVGIKDLIDTRDMPTAYGSPVYRGRAYRRVHPTGGRGDLREDGDDRVRLA